MQKNISHLGINREIGMIVWRELHWWAWLTRANLILFLHLFHWDGAGVYHLGLHRVHCSTCSKLNTETDWTGDDVVRPGIILSEMVLGLKYGHLMANTCWVPYWTDLHLIDLDGASTFVFHPISVRWRKKFLYTFNYPRVLQCMFMCIQFLIG